MEKKVEPAGDRSHYAWKVVAGQQLEVDGPVVIRKAKKRDRIIVEADRGTKIRRVPERCSVCGGVVCPAGRDPLQESFDPCLCQGVA